MNGTREKKLCAKLSPKYWCNLCKMYGSNPWFQCVCSIIYRCFWLYISLHLHQYNYTVKLCVCACVCVFFALDIHINTFDGIYLLLNYRQYIVATEPTTTTHTKKLATHSHSFVHTCIGGIERVHCTLCFVFLFCSTQHGTVLWSVVQPKMCFSYCILFTIAFTNTRFYHLWMYTNIVTTHKWIGHAGAYICLCFFVFCFLCTYLAKLACWCGV